MAMLVLDGDMTNAHHVEDFNLTDVVRGCRIDLGGVRESAALYRCIRPAKGEALEATFHILTPVPSEGHDLMIAARFRSRKGDIA